MINLIKISNQAKASWDLLHTSQPLVLLITNPLNSLTKSIVKKLTLSKTLVLFATSQPSDLLIISLLRGSMTALNANKAFKLLV